MKKLLIAGLLALFPSLAWGQCTGIFPANTLCGNLSGSPGPPAAFSASSSIVGPGSAAVNDLTLWANVGGTQLKDGTGQTIPGTYTWSGANTWNGTSTFGNTATFSSTTNLNGTTIVGGAATFNAAATFTSSLTATGLITLSDLASLGANTVIGSIAGGTPIALSQAQLTGMLAFTSPLTGGVARTVTSKLAEYPSVTDFGAKCDGTTDDTTAIQSALTNIPSGGTLLFPSLCKVIGSGTAVLTRGTPISLVGTGMYTSGILVDSTVPNTRTVLFIQPAAHTQGRGYSMFNMGIFPNSGTPGLHMLNFDSTSAMDTEIADVLISHVYIVSSITGGYAILLHNLPANANGGLFNFILNNASVIVGGIHMDSIGDSIRIHDSIITGVNAGISGTQVAGAGNLLIDGNNITGTGGGVVLDCAVSPRITNNEFEQQVTSTEVNNSIVDISAGSCTIDNLVFANNQVQSSASVGNPTLLNLNVNNSNPVVENNRFAVPAVYACVINASASLTCIANAWHTCTTHISGTAPANSLGC
jgi:hypothetical protein